MRKASNPDGASVAVRISVALGLAVVVAGCGDGHARVEAVVLLDGERVAKTESRRCEVTLKPTAGGPAASGSADESGRIQLRIGSSRSLPPGEYRGSVRVREVTPSPNPGGYSSSVDLAPTEYASTATSGLTFQITPGSNQIDIEIDRAND